ncbi:hypothetical protein RB594_008655 [Gaeumannomyces avenae]
MRLINTRTLQLGEDAPEPGGGYAIFSHKWGLEEVTFQDMTQLDESTLRDKAGYAKVENVCRIARGMGLQHVWIDTCCIDKTRSAEVSQCLNAMFRWYKKSAVCIVYLHDFRPDPGLELGQGLVDSLAKCQWFQRAWTLQELIAPEYVRFFDHEWKFYGSKFNDKKRVARDSEDPEALLADLYAITHIPIPVLRDPDTVWSYPVGNRMSWAAHRRALYVEDLAYSLIGIFNVSMPMLYGEGNRAFIRLQEEIIKETNDMTIFAWTASDRQEMHRYRWPRAPRGDATSGSSGSTSASSPVPPISLPPSTAYGTVRRRPRHPFPWSTSTASTRASPAPRRRSVGSPTSPRRCSTACFPTAARPSTWGGAPSFSLAPALYGRTPT